jgi:protein-L-isoaspartate(D-aspartate) O-methyltransferase
MIDPVEAARRVYAERLRITTHMRSSALFDAFATVPRERFVGPGPWRILEDDKFWTTGDADPRLVYQNTLIALDATKGINNGQPSLWALYFDQLGVRVSDDVLHLGCGTGYYTAILAELTGPLGRITAVEIDERIAERARVALEPWPQVRVVHGDGSSGPFELVDVLVASAGATHPMPSWLAAIKRGGRMLFPLTSTEGAGAMVFLRRMSEDYFEARISFGTYFIEFRGACDLQEGRRLFEALKRDRGTTVRSLRCDRHVHEKSCWLHGDGWCFSTRDPIQSVSAA